MIDFNTALAEAKAKLPLDALMRHLGYGPEFIKASCKSPFREEKTPSWGVFTGDNGELRWKDFTTGETGDQIDFLALHAGSSTREAMDAFFELAGVPWRSYEHRPVSRRPVRVPEPLPEPEPEPAALKPFNWEACIAAFDDERQEGFSKWRGYSPEFVAWLKEQGHVGIYDGCPATPVIKDGVVVGCQYRTKDGPRYANATPGEKTPAEPLLIGQPGADIFLAMESPWDAFALMEAMGCHKTANSMLCLAVTRSASNHAKLIDVLQERAKSDAPGDVILAGQNDPPRKDGKPTGHDTLEAGLRKLCAETGLTLKLAMPPARVKDFNDWWREQPDRMEVIAVLEEAKASSKSKLTIRSVKELLGFAFTDSDNYFGDRILAEGQPATILGPGGVGKSRIVLQQAISMILGREFLGVKTHASWKRWLFIQTENSNRRLQVDLKGMIQGMKLGAAAMQALEECLIIHTIEHEGDGFLALENRDEFQAVQNLITDLNPDFVVFDPLNTFTLGDLNSDADMRALCTAITQATKRGNPKRVPIVLHHSLTGKAGAQRATGWDKASYGRNSKVLQAWTRSQVNIVPRDPEDATKLLITCGKNNNGAHFPDIAAAFDEDAGIYVVDESYDPQEFQESVGNVRKSKGSKVKYDPAEVVDLFQEDIVSFDLIELIKKHYKCGNTKAYSIMSEAKRAGYVDYYKADASTVKYRKGDLK